jgi:hypothetical protein
MCDLLFKKNTLSHKHNAICKGLDATAFVSLLHFMICHSRKAIDPAPQDVIKTTRWNNSVFQLYSPATSGPAEDQADTRRDPSRLNITFLTRAKPSLHPSSDSPLLLLLLFEALGRQKVVSGHKMISTSRQTNSLSKMEFLHTATVPLLAHNSQSCSEDMANQPCAVRTLTC